MEKENKINLIGEIGINHNGDLELAKKLILYAVLTGFDYVKFQKRTPDLCVPEDQKKIMKSTPWGEMTYLDYKEKIEFNEDDYNVINKFCDQWGIDWFASAWDIPSATFLKKYCTMVKIPSALITELELLKFCRENFRTVMISTGMSEEAEIEKAVEIGNPNIILHTNSAYPSPPEELNFEYIDFLKNKYPGKQIGYSGHEWGLSTTYAVALKVSWIERHITLDHGLWGSDQKSSVDPVGMVKFVRSIRDIEKAKGGNEPRKLSKSELEKRKSLRK
jgi:N-acetylneuraminate synthase